MFDIALEPKPKAYLMKSLFTEEPLVHLAIEEDNKADVMWNGVQTGNRQLSELWNREEGSKVNLLTFTNCDEVELWLNGRRLGRKANPKDAGHRNQIRWEGIAYHKGKLEAVGYIDNKVVTRHALETTGKPVRIVAEPDNSHWKADGIDLQHVRLTAVDRKGRRVRTYNDELTFEVEGDAKIVAVTNGDITSDEVNTGKHGRLWQGSAMVILRAGTAPSQITLKTSPATFKTMTTKLETK